MKKFFKMIVWIIVIIVVLFGGFILYITLSDYRPNKVEVILEADNHIKSTFPGQNNFTLISWNIGYAGLGAEMDFFYDGGKKVRPGKEQNQRYLNGIKKYIKDSDADFYLLQEVDIRSRRSFRINQVEAITNLKTDFSYQFALNYKVPFVPVPVNEPMGKVKGGIMILSKDEPYYAERIAYPLIAAWPDRLFLLDRCFILSRYKLDNGKDLLVINTHNSAYVYDSTLRYQEFNIIKKTMLDEYEKGNYIIAGGDWNANPPYLKPEGTFNGHKFESSKVKMNNDFLPPEWNWAFASNAPTNRNNDTAFRKGENGTTVIDFFVASPNIKILEVKNIDLDFEFSDHNPVYLNIQIINSG